MSSPSSRRRLVGTVVSTAMQQTAVVRIDRSVAHPKYGKRYTQSRRFKIHDPADQAQVGDVVEFEECRPLSKDKCWRYLRTVTAAPQVGRAAEPQDV